MDPHQKVRLRGTGQDPEVIDVAKIDDLKGTELFRDVDDEAIKRIIGTDLRTSPSRISKLNANKLLSTSRSDGDYLYVILKGYVAIWIPSCFDEEEKVFLAWRGPQQIIGELREVGATPSLTEIKTCDPCEFIEIRLDFFHDLARAHCFLYRNVANLILKKMSNEGHRAEVVQMRPYKRQVAQTLIHLAQDRCEDFSFEQSELRIPGTIPQHLLGAYAGVGRRRVTTELNSLREQKIIKYHGTNRGSRITILQLQELKKIVETRTNP